MQKQNQYLNYLIDLSFQEVNRLFVLSFSSDAVRTGYAKYYLRRVEKKDYSVTIDGQKFFDQLVKMI